VLTGCYEDKIATAAAAVDRAGSWTAVYGNGDAGGAMLDALRLR
jgi:hypothetical protein